jgi:hypothetical protein
VRARIGATIGMAAAVMLTLAGCGFITPQATTEDYEASDGTNAQVGNIKVLNAMVITQDGEDGNLIASVANKGDERITVTLQFESGSKDVNKKVSVPGGEFKSLGSEEPFLLEGIDTKPGELLPVFVQYGDETGKQMLVPVLDGSLPEYAELLP